MSYRGLDITSILFYPSTQECRVMGGVVQSNFVFALCSPIWPQPNNLSSIFDIGDIPSDSQLRELLDAPDYAPVSDLYRQWFVRLQRSKQLDSCRMFGERYLVTIDGSEYFNSESISCSHCLTRHKSNGHVEHYHQVLQPALVHPDHSQVIPLAPEFIRRQDGANKQDCEVVASTGYYR